MLIWYRKGINIGSFVNMIGIAYVSDLVVYVCGRAGLTAQGIDDSLIIRLSIMLLAVAFCCTGVAFYVECELGVAPYDALGQMIESWTRGKVKFTVARIGFDVICVSIGFFTGSVVEIATLVMACMTGPLVTFIRENIAVKVIGNRS